MKKITKETCRTLFQDYQRILVGGFLTNGTPEALIDCLVESNVKHLTIIANDAGFENQGVGKLIQNNQVDHLSASHIGTNPLAGTLMQNGTLKITLVPQGTLIEQIRAGGAGLGGILTPTGRNTMVEEGKTIIDVDGISYLLEKAIHADVALVGGCISDSFGNLTYHMSQRNFNPMLALNAKMVIAQPVRVVEMHDPEVIITPYVLVDYLLEETHG